MLSPAQRAAVASAVVVDVVAYGAVAVSAWELFPNGVLMLFGVAALVSLAVAWTARRSRASPVLVSIAIGYPLFWFAGLIVAVFAGIGVFRMGEPNMLLPVLVGAAGAAYCTPIAIRIWRGLLRVSQRPGARDDEARSQDREAFSAS